MEIKWIILLYLLGYWISYIILRMINNKRDWSIIFVCLIISLCSWITIIMVVIVIFIAVPIVEYLKIKEPPKWL